MGSEARGGGAAGGRRGGAAGAGRGAPSGSRRARAGPSPRGGGDTRRCARKQDPGGGPGCAPARPGAGKLSEPGAAAGTGPRALGREGAPRLGVSVTRGGPLGAFGREARAWEGGPGGPGDRGARSGSPGGACRRRRGPGRPPPEGGGRAPGRPPEGGGLRRPRVAPGGRGKRALPPAGPVGARAARGRPHPEGGLREPPGWSSGFQTRSLRARTCFVTLGRSLHLFELRLAHLSSGGDTSPTLQDPWE